MGNENYYTECSALTGQGIEEIFQLALKIITKKEKKKQKKISWNFKISDNIFFK